MLGQRCRLWKGKSQDPEHSSGVKAQSGGIDGRSFRRSTPSPPLWESIANSSQCEPGRLPARMGRSPSDYLLPHKSQLRGIRLQLTLTDFGGAFPRRPNRVHSAALGQELCLAHCTFLLGARHFKSPPSRPENKATRWCCFWHRRSVTKLVAGRLQPS